jgi:hypothetical protein
VEEMISAKSSQQVGGKQYQISTISVKRMSICYMRTELVGAFFQFFVDSEPKFRHP